MYLKSSNKEIKKMNIRKAGAPFQYSDGYVTFLAFLKIGFKMPYRMVQGVELRNEMEKYRLEDPKKFLNVLRAFKRYKYDDKRIVAEFSNRGSMKKERVEIEFDRCRLENRIIKAKDVLPLVEQIMRLNIGIGEILVEYWIDGLCTTAKY